MNDATSRPELSPPVRDYLLTLADDEHMVGARHTAWIGLGPFLEEDLAFCSIAQDELGHAIALYRIVVDRTHPSPADQTGHDLDLAVDELALGRNPEEYRSSWLAERECVEWGHSLVRHWFYDRAEALRLDNIEASRLSDLAALVPGQRREEAFHLRHAETFMSRIVAEEPRRIGAVIDELLPLASTMFVPPSTEPDALAEGVAARPFEALAVAWSAAIAGDLTRWGAPTSLVDLASRLPDAPQGNRAERSAEFAAFLSDLNSVRSIDPGAIW